MARRGGGRAGQSVPGPGVPDGSDESAPATPGSASQPEPVPALDSLVTPGDVWEGGQIRAAGEDHDGDDAGDPGGDHK